VFAGVYLLLAFGAAGAGYGTGIFFAAILPYGLGLLVFPILAFLAGDLRPFMSKVIFVSVLVLHYALVINFLRLEWMIDPVRIGRTWHSWPVNIILPAAFYFGAQLLLWFLFVRNALQLGGATEQIVGPERR
jgi:hypothetical protein